MQVRVYEDSQHRFHYQAYEPGVKGGRNTAMLCGALPANLREAAWFAVGDRRGRVHYDLGCTPCRSELTA